MSAIDTPVAEKTQYQGTNAASSAAERRRAALSEIDEAKFSWFHAKACIVAGECQARNAQWRSLPRQSDTFRHGCRTHVVSRHTVCHLDAYLSSGSDERPCDRMDDREGA